MRHLNVPERAPQVGGQLFGVLQILILKQHKIFKISFFHRFYLSFEKNYLSPNITKNHYKIYKKARNVDRWYEHSDFFLELNIIFSVIGCTHLMNTLRWNSLTRDPWVGLLPQPTPSTRSTKWTNGTWDQRNCVNELTIPNLYNKLHPANTLALETILLR